MDKTITFIVSADGSQVDIDADGFVGKGCMDFAQRTIDALGTITEKREKPEMYASEGAGQTIRR